MTKDQLMDKVNGMTIEEIDEELRSSGADPVRIAREGAAFVKVLLTRRAGGPQFASNLAWAVESAARPKLDSADIRADALRYLVACHEYVEVLNRERERSLKAVGVDA